MPPSLRYPRELVPFSPPQTIIRPEAQTAPAYRRGGGVPTMDVAVQLSVTGSYRAPSLSMPIGGPPIGYPPSPPHTTSWVPVQAEEGPVRTIGAPIGETGLHALPTGS